MQSSKSESPLSDVQEFGDHLEVLAANVDDGRKFVAEVAQSNNMQVPEVEVSEPSLENVFVLELKGSKQDIGEYKEFEFREFKDHQTGRIAVGADDIAISFGDFQAVKGVSINIGYGEIFGLLGANGAGKTTTIKMLCGLLQPSRGTMTLAGERSNLRSSALRRRIGYMSQKFTLYNDLNVLENLQFYCGVYEVPRKEREERIHWVLDTCGLRGQEALLTASLPGGWKQRLSFGASVMHQPEILFLDEPTSGVDPLARRQLWRLMRQFARHGTAILVTTHFLDEAEHCQRLAFMVAGEIVAQGTPSEIKRAQPGKVIEVTTPDPARAARIVRSELEAWRVASFANSVQLTLDDQNQWPSLEKKLLSNNIKIEAMRPIRTTLEDAFISTVQRASAKA
jgi:ABC-2 type transport system ATP-binding protein